MSQQRASRLLRAGGCGGALLQVAWTIFHASSWAYSSQAQAAANTL